MRSDDPDLILNMNRTARAAGLNGCLIDNNKALRIITDNIIAFDFWVSEYENNKAISFTRPPDSYIFKPYLIEGNHKSISDIDLTPSGYRGNNYYIANQLASIYNFPAPNPAIKVVVGVLSFGGGLYGNLSGDGVLTDGDVQKYWESIGIPSNQWPTVVVVPIGDATNNPNDPNYGYTCENTVDIETIGACCPSANLTIILYIVPNELAKFATVFSYAFNTPVFVNGAYVKPSILSISWGAPEIFFDSGEISQINSVLKTASAAGINICAATGTYISTNDEPATRLHCDFPSASPFVTAVGGTTLRCSSNIYDVNTVERAYYNSGGVSVKLSKPDYQSAIDVTGRAIPDIALNADPNTGVVYLVNNKPYVFGGTSIGAPLLAAFMAATNISTFINPKLYKAGPDCFHDVTIGSSGQYIGATLYNSCTGFGSINAINMLNTFQSVLATDLTLSVESLSLTLGQVAGINFTLEPSDVTINRVTWSSSNTDIVTVDRYGVVSGVSIGKADIICSTLDYSNISVSIPVTINTIVNVTNVILPSIPIIHVGDSIQLNPVIFPNNAANKKVSWLSSDSTIATVSDSGLVSGLSFGTCVITCSSNDGNIQATRSVIVTIPVETISITPNNIAMRVGQTRGLAVTVSPSNATNKGVIWRSANTTKAVANADGVIMAVETGTTIINASSVDTGIVAQCTVTIT